MTLEEYEKKLKVRKYIINEHEGIIKSHQKVINEHNEKIEKLRKDYVEANKKFNTGDKVLYQNLYGGSGLVEGIIGKITWRIGSIWQVIQDPIRIVYTVQKIKKDGTVSARFWSDFATESELTLIKDEDSNI